MIKKYWMYTHTRLSSTWQGAEKARLGGVQICQLGRLANSWARPHLTVQTCPDPRSWFWGWQGSQIGSNLQAAHSWPDNRLIWLESVSSRPGTSRGRSPLRQFTQNCRVMQESPTTGVPNHLVLSIVRACSRVKLFTHLFWSFLPLREFGHHHVPGSCFSSLLIIIYSSVLQHRSRVSKVFFGVSCNTAIGQGGAPWHPGRWSVNLPVDPLGDYTQVDLRRWRSTHSRRRQKVGVSLGGDANMLYHGTRLLAW